MQRSILVCGMILTSAATLFAQKGAVTTSSIPRDLTPRGLFAAQTEPKSITLSWYSQALPRNATGAQFIICNIGGRDTRPSEKSWGKMEGRGMERPEPLLQTYVLQVTSEVPHQCRLELRARMDATSKNDQVERFPFNEVTPKLSPAPVPPSPTQVEATLVAPSRVRVTWTGSGEVTAVLIQRRMAPRGLITVCYLCPPIGVFVDSVSSTGRPSSVQYAVTSIGRSGRSRPATSRELRFDARNPVATGDTTTPLPAGVVVTTIAAGSLPPSGHVARSTLQENEKTVTQILRVGPAAQIPVHHHPHYNETVIVHSGEIELMIGGQRHFLRAGQVAYIPAGTTMSAVNTSRVNEAQVVAVFSNVGTTGPLMVAGPGSN